MESIENLTLDELQEEYLQLMQRNQVLQETHESDTQRIHELKRCLDTAAATEAYLTQELEQLTAPNDAQAAALHKAQSELEEVRRKNAVLQASNSTLQQEYDTLCEEQATLRDQVKELTASLGEKAPQVDASSMKDHYDKLAMLEQNNMELLEKLEEFHEKSIQQTMAMAEKERQIEILRDQVTCFEENMRCKRDELEEKTQLLESAQDQLAEANAELAMLKSAPETNDRKGNSLFAEVDDQRQAMKQLLASQKASYLQMKKVFNDSEHEIRRLKRENIAMQTELQACSTIFCSADKTYQEKLNERIRHLSHTNDELTGKLKWTQDRLKELADDKGVQWLESMFNYCKQETDDLKKQLHSLRIKKASLDEQLRNVQQDMARWRFESLKSRCVLLDRENLLTENNIKFKPVRDVEFRPNLLQLEKARPRIVSAAIEKPPVKPAISSVEPEPSVESPEPVESPVKVKSEPVTMEPKTEEAVNPAVIEQTLPIEAIVPLDVDTDIKPIKAELISPQEPSPATPIAALPLHEEIKLLKVKDFAHVEQMGVAPEQPKPLQEQRSPTSILSKPRDAFTAAMAGPAKQVKFSSESATVHTLSPDHVLESPVTDNKENLQRHPLMRRMKSTVVVQRFVMGSKKVHLK